jgi:hypothetical protein
MKMLLIALRAIRELEARFRCDWPAGHVCRGLGEGLLGSSVANSLCPGQEKRTMREPEVQIRNFRMKRISGRTCATS